MFSSFIRFLSVFLCCFANFSYAAPPSSFSQAKVLLKNTVYFDQNQKGEQGTLYCGCDWQWVGRSGGRADLASCHYQIRAQESRAKRTEYEHIVPAYVFGSQRQCWQHGGRKNCVRTDEQFGRMEADMFNLDIAIGEVNADRSNFRYGVVSGKEGMYGQCTSKTDFKQRIFEPRDSVKGMVARTSFYMYDRYNLRMSSQQQKLFMAWHKQYPVSAWELERNKRISAVMGHENEFVTGKRHWQLNHKNSGDGLLPGK